MNRSEHSKTFSIYARRGVSLAGACLLAVFTWGCNGSVHQNDSANQALGAQSFSISGAVSPATGGSGASVTLSGASTATATANSSGAYSFSGLAKGTYAVTPSNPGFTFSPAAQPATITTANVTGVNFTATAVTGPTSSISGTITPTAGGSGATVLLSGPVAATTITNASGSYTLSELPNGAYIVTPNESGFTFTPASHSVTLSGANQTGVNFTAVVGQAHTVVLNWNASTSTVSGYNIYRSTASGTGFTKLNSTLVNALNYSDSNVQSGTTYFYVATAVDSGGDESPNSNQASAVIP
ncbi:MAG: carboxypeptidase regulatory-like domain-containing protein [Candidatus Acidiferrum sp.]